MQEALAKEGSEETLNEIKTGSNRDLNLRSAVNSVGEGEEEKKSGGLLFSCSRSYGDTGSWPLSLPAKVCQSKFESGSIAGCCCK